MEITELLALAQRRGASDLHLAAGQPPLLRVDGEVRSMNDELLTAPRVGDMIASIMNEKQQREFEELLEIDFSYALPRAGRFRVNAFNQMSGPSCVFRTIPSEVPTLEQLSTPKVLKEICAERRGIVLVTGPTGSGKSTTLAAMVDYINQTRREHILTIENPIEFVHTSKQCLINQRELGRDTLGFSQALRSALREDPDVILVGEMRDLETIRLALTAAETGHLVFATLHTSSAAKTVDRIVDVFPAAEKDLVRTMLSESLRAVIAQTLLKKIGGGRVAAWELMIAKPAIRHLIRENKVAQIRSVVQTSRSEGMQTLDQSLEHLIHEGLISVQEARRYAEEKDLFPTSEEEAVEPVSSAEGKGAGGGVHVVGTESRARRG
jgi:twitching motility protein PilT